MRDFQTKVDDTAPSSTGRYSAGEFNALSDEIENIAIAAGRALDGAFGPDTDTSMLAQAVSSHASGGIFGQDTGAANIYVVNTPGAFRMPHAYFKGMCVRWYPNATNTGASTLNAWGLGVKKLLDHRGEPLTGGELAGNQLVDAFYDPALDSGTGAFRLAPWANALKLYANGVGGGDTGTVLRTLTFSYTGADQSYVVPAGVTEIEVLAWGASSQSSWSGYLSPGGYVSGRLTVTPGDNFRVVVGQAGSDFNSGGAPEPGGVGSTTYGFGGAASDDAGALAQDGGQSGGGLTGLFTGTSTVANGDTSRARFVAGGGGGPVTLTSDNHQRGRNGGAPGAGGQSTMQGASGSSSNESGGGGGGYAGGSIVSFVGNGGTNYLHTSVVNPVSLYTPDGAEGIPNATDPNYVFSLNGRLIIKERA